MQTSKLQTIEGDPMSTPSDPQPVSIAAETGKITGPVLQHAFDIRLEFDQRVMFGPVSGGGQMGFVRVAGGTIEGPLLNGRVVPHSGGDYAHVRPDGVVETNAHYLLEASDGTLIYIYNRGVVDRSHGVGLVNSERDRNAPGMNFYFRVNPTFKAPLGPHEWLTRTVFIGVAERRQNPDHSLFRYYAVV
jgi:hypothetical protein